MEQVPLGILLGCAARAARQDMDMRIKDFGITPVQARAMATLHENRGREFSQKDLERALRLRGSTVNGIVDRLEEKGLIARRPSLQDGRRNDLVLTEVGEEMCLRFRESLQGAETALRSGFSDQELEQLQEYLLRIARRMSEEEA